MTLRGERVTSARLADGDVVQIGRLNLVMEIHDEAGARKPSGSAPRNPIETIRAGDTGNEGDGDLARAGAAAPARRGSHAGILVVIGAILGAVAVIALVV